MCRRRRLTGVLDALAVVAFATTSTGGEFRINTQTTGAQGVPAIAMDAYGGFVVVWVSAGIKGRRYDASGVAVGDEILINSAGVSLHPDVASDVSGNFVVAWTATQGDGDSYGVFARRYDSLGSPRGVEFQVNTHTSSRQLFPRVAADGEGGFVVVWQSENQDGSGSGIFGQRFSPSGNRLGLEFAVNTYTTGSQQVPDVASDGVGNFMVVWSSATVGIARKIAGRAYSVSAGEFGPEFQVSSYTTMLLVEPVVSTDLFATQFVAAWAELDGANSDAEVVARRLEASGSPIGPEFQVNSYTTASQRQPAALAALSAGGFVIAWYSEGQDGSGEGIFAQIYDSEANPLRPEFAVNTYTTGRQWRVSGAAFTADRFVLAWQSDGQDGSGAGVFGLRYGDVIFGDGFEPAVP